MADWTRVMIDGGSGLGAGAVDQLVQNWDEKRVTANPALPIWQQGGTWLNYIAPAAVVVGVGTGFIKGTWGERLTVIAGQLVGRKLTHRFTKGPNSPFPSPAPYSDWQRASALEEARRREAMAAGARGRTYDKELDSMNLI